MNGTVRLLTALLAAGAVALAGAGLDDAQAADVTAKVGKNRLLVESQAGNAKITLRLRAGHRQQLVVDADSDGDAEFRFDRRTFNRIVVDGRRGNDVIRIGEKHGVFTTTETTTILGGRGNDTILGGSGSEQLVGGPGVDTISAGGRADVVFLGPGHDVFLWKTGDGADVVEGQDGSDTLRADGSAADESFGTTANGGRIRLEGNGGVAIDTAGFERVDIRPLGGSDTLTVGDLSGTRVTALDVDLGPADGGTNALIVNGTNGDDTTTVSGTSGGVTINGLAALITLTGSGLTDTLRVNVLAGDDVIDASGLAAGVLPLVLDGGAGDDVLIGSAGPDIVFGGDGDDVLIGGPGTDVLDGGAGDDVIIQD